MTIADRGVQGISYAERLIRTDNRLLSKPHSLAKITLFPPIFIVSSQRPILGRLVDTM